jgi:ABC-type Fe3+/spermidine/putrescine transport system ATPase subunit
MLLEVHNVSKSFGSQAILRGCTLSLESASTLSVIGRSGSGKTTLLKIIAGLVREDGGAIWINGKSMAGIPPEQRNCVYLYQEPLLFPHLNVRDNVAFGLRVRNVGAKELRRQADAMLEEVDLITHARKMPHEISGGQKQRVAFARALVVRPTVLLLDEPFASLDTETRSAMQTLYKTIAAEHRITALFVTHDLKEAMIMGAINNGIASMHDGVLKQYSSREALLDAPEIGLQKELAFWETFKLHSR